MCIRDSNIPCDLKDTAWFGKIDASGGAVFFASGVFYYFLTQQVRELVRGMADAFPGSVLVFDAANRTAVKMIAKTWLKTAKIKDVGAYFAVSDAAKEIGTWDSRCLLYTSASQTTSDLFAGNADDLNRMATLTRGLGKRLDHGVGIGALARATTQYNDIHKNLPPSCRRRAAYFLF